MTVDPAVCEAHSRRMWESPQGPWCPFCEDRPPTLDEAVADGIRVIAHGVVGWESPSPDGG